MVDSMSEVRLETPALDPRPAVTSAGALGQGLRTRSPAIRFLRTSHWGPWGKYGAGPRRLGCWPSWGNRSQGQTMREPPTLNPFVLTAVRLGGGGGRGASVVLSNHRSLPRGRGFSKLPICMTLLSSSSVLLPGSLQEGVREPFSFYMVLGYLLLPVCWGRR